jgi:hypothetical protein
MAQRHGREQHALTGDRATTIGRIPKRFLSIQEHKAQWWRDAVLQYFQSFSHLPLPTGVETPAHLLSYYMTLRCPRDEHKPRCDAIP